MTSCLGFTLKSLDAADCKQILTTAADKLQAVFEAEKSCLVSNHQQSNQRSYLFICLFRNGARAHLSKWFHRAN